MSCKSHFSIDKTTHHKVVVNESSNTEFIKVYLVGVSEGVEFESITYNRAKLDVSVEEDKEGVTKITAIKQNGGPLIIGKEKPEMVDEPNQLTYRVDDKKHHVLLSDIEYLPTKFK